MKVLSQISPRVRNKSRNQKRNISYYVITFENIVSSTLKVYQTMIIETTSHVTCILVKVKCPTKKNERKTDESVMIFLSCYDNKTRYVRFNQFYRYLCCYRMDLTFSQFRYVARHSKARYSRYYNGKSGVH